MSQPLLLWTDDPGHGGVAQYNFSMLVALAALGPTALVQQHNAKAEAVAAAHGVATRWLPYDAAREFGRAMDNVAECAAVLAELRPRATLFSDCCPFSNLGARQAAAEAGIPFMCVVGFVAPYLATTFADRLPELARHYALASQVVGVSQENLGLLRGLFGLAPDKGLVIHYGRPPRFFAPRDAGVRAKLRGRLGVPPAACLCFTAGRLESVKGYQYQLAAIELLRRDKAWKSIFFAWAGGGAIEPELRAYIAANNLGSRVHLLGDVDAIAEWLDAADVFVLPSEAEGMPLAIMEAMAKGLPVVATSVSGIPEELGETGRLLPDPQADEQGVVRGLSSALAAWAGDPAARVAAGRACKTRAEAMFREERMVREMMALVERLPASRGHG